MLRAHGGLGSPHQTFLNITGPEAKHSTAAYVFLDATTIMASGLTAMPQEALRLPFRFPLYTVLSLLVILVVRSIYNKFQPGLRDIPGPATAAYTKLWRVYDVWKGTSHLTAIELHRKHGPLARIGPNVVSVSDPDFIPIIYSIKEDYTKTAFYPIQCISWKKQPAMSLFATRDPNGEAPLAWYRSAESAPQHLSFTEASMAQTCFGLRSDEPQNTESPNARSALHTPSRISSNPKPPSTPASSSSCPV